MPLAARASSMPWRDARELLGVGEPDRRGVVGRGDQLDVDRALGGARLQVLVGDVAVVLGGADHARREVVGAQEVEEVVPHVAVVGAERARRDRRGRCARRAGGSAPGGAVPSRWTCSSASAALTPRASAQRRWAAGCVARPAKAARSAARRRARPPPSPRAWTTASGRSPGPTSSPSPATSARPDGVVDRVVLAPAAAAEPEHGEADVADVDRVHVARRSRARPRARAARAGGGGRVARAGRPGRRARRTIAREALGGGAGVERLARPPRARRPRRAPGRRARSSARRQRERDLEQPRLARARVGQHLDRLAHLERVAGGRAEHLVHVGEQRAAGAGRRRSATSTSAARQLAASLARSGHERAGAGLDVQHQRVEAGGELLGQDRGDDQRDRLDRAGRVAQRVQAPVGGREVGGLADDRAAGLATDARAARSRSGVGR